MRLIRTSSLLVGDIGSRNLRALALLLCMAMLAPLVASAQIVPTWREEYDKRLKYGEMAEPLKGDIFGESVNVYDGSVSFHRTDISLPGNSGLAVEYGRKFEAGEGWQMDIPSLSGMFGADDATVAAGYWAPAARCSTVAAPPTVSVPNHRHTYNVDFAPHTYWEGTRLSLPGAKGGELLGNSGDARQVRPDGMTVSWNTKDGWFFSCLSSLKSGQPGQGFLGHAPDGTKYYFDWMTVRDAGQSHLQMWDADSHAVLNKNRVHLYPTQVVDRFGNWVRYEWDGSRLQRIHANDGRQITFATDANGTILTATANGRTWTYAGGGSTGQESSVTLPDGTAWLYNLAYTHIPYVPRKTGDQPSDYQVRMSLCARLGKIVDEERVHTVVHPSGVVGTFRMRPIRHGRYGVRFDCQESGVDGTMETGYNQTPLYRDAYSLVSKTVSGAGIPTATWQYAYSNLGGRYNVNVTQAGWPAYPVGQAEPKITTETLPDGVVKVHEFGKEVGYNDGRLLRVTTRQNGVVVKTETTAYYPHADLASAPFPQTAGRSFVYGSDELIAHGNQPVTRAAVTQDGVTFINETTAFDAQVRPLTVKESNTAGMSRTQTTTYMDRRDLWLMGQTQSTATNGTEVSRTEFDTATGQPIKQYSFNRLVQQVGYASDGSPSTLTDGRGNTTHFSAWKRGVPQQIRFPATEEAPAGAIRSVSVDDNGWITGLTDETGATSTYEYDPVGRLKARRFPAGDTVTWNPITYTFQKTTSAQYGLPAGVWKHTRTLGTQRVETWLDALYRPVLVTSGINSTVDNAVVTRYDITGQTSFVSYPARGVTSVGQTLDGTSTQYDAHGRPVRVSADSELWPLVSTNEYIGNLQVKVTNPRGVATTTRHRTYAEPKYDMPLVITHLEGVTTTIARNTFDNPTSITRAGNGQSLARRYVYNGYQQLCKTIEPETGMTIQDYDAAGNLLWSASGISSTNTTACDLATGRASARLVQRTYDAQNRLLQLQFKDGRGNQQWRYTPDGLPAEVTTQNDTSRLPVVNRYDYNRRRLLVSESLDNAPVGALTLGYRYDANGSLSGHTYPGGRSVGYTPDALGRATVVGSFATAASYHANGALARFLYGNGVEHTMTRNRRGLPERSRDALGGTVALDDSYDYDANGNVEAISDGRAGAPGNRDMTYDALDRLLTVTAPGFGNALYEYDALDNLRRAKVGTRDRTHYFDASNRLVNVMETATNATVVGLAYDVQGNLSARNGVSYTFDHGNRLRAAGNLETYAYDAHGRRVSSTGTDGTIYSFYDNAGVLRFQRNERTGKQTDYMYLAGSLVAQASKAAAPTVPALSAPGYVTQGAVTLTWTAAGGATRYEVQRTQSTTWSTLYTGSALTYSNSGLTTGTWQYRVRGCRDVCGAWSNIATVSVELPPSAAPTVSVPATTFNGTLRVTWTAAAGAARYELDESVNSGAWAKIQDGTTLARDMTGKAAGGYRYRVRACNPAGCTAYSAIASSTMVYPPTATSTIDLATRFAPGAITVNWSAVTGANRYQLQERVGTGAWAALYDGTARTFTTPARAVGSYGYRVAACNGAGCGTWSAIKSTSVIGPPTLEPTISAATLVSVPQLSLSWTSPANSERFELQESANGAAWTQVQNSAAMTFSAGRGEGSYAYRVRACNFAGCGPMSGVVTITVSLPPATPTFHTAEWLTTRRAPYQVQCSVGWSAVAGATSYDLQSEGGGKTLYSGPKTYVSDYGNAYCSGAYRVRACSAGGCSAWSSPDYPVTQGYMEE